MIERLKTDNGITLLLEQLPALRTACFGCFVESGSRHEPLRLTGISHFIEHMLFKGTKTRTAGDIAREFDLLGGQSNAYTSKEGTAFYAKTLDSHLPCAIAILGDMIVNSTFSQRDIELERRVILEEISMYEDSPEDLVVDRLIERVYAGQAIGREILGSESSLSQLNGDILQEYKYNNYTTGNIVLSVSGSFDRAAVVAACNSAFAGLCEVAPQRESAPVIYKKSLMCEKKEIEQNHLCLAFPSLSYNDEFCFDAEVVGNILGSGMSSRLFQKLREERGLVYSVYSFSMPQKDSGFGGIYAAQNPKAEREAAERIVEITRDMVKNGVSADELRRAKEHFKVNTIMGFESSYSRMAHMAKGELFMGGKILTADETIEKIDAVSLERVEALLPVIFDFSKLSVGVVGTPADEGFYLGL